jgi:hypothetical protein
VFEPVQQERVVAVGAAAVVAAVVVVVDARVVAAGRVRSRMVLVRVGRVLECIHQLFFSW